MDFRDSVARAKKYVGGIEGAECFITDKGVFRVKMFSSDKLKYRVFVKKGITYVENEKGKRIQPAKKVSSKLPDSSDAKPD